MRRQALLLAAAAAMAATASATAAEPVEDAREVASFSEIALNGAVDATITAGEARSVVIVTEPAQQGHVATEVRGATLVIETDDDTRFDAPVSARISVPALTGLAINGSGDSEVRATNSQRFSLAINGSGDAEARGIDSQDFSLDINGSGDVVLAGRCETASYDIHGSGDVAAKGLECSEGTVDIAGSGDVMIFASDTAAVDVAGSGDVEIWGGARLREVDLSGSGDVTTRGQ